jgi:serine/threonine-protein kinase
MGEVYLAEHELLKRPCAVKVIRPGKVGDSRALERFAREVRSAARLSHWNSIEIFDYGRTDDGTFFYVMEYLPGRNLEELVGLDGPMPASRVLYFLRQICDALDEAHAMGMIHRDIKPSNVFAAQRGGRFDVAKLLDFGLVKDVQPQTGPHLTYEGDITGSPLYIAPEIAGGDTFDARADIYSLGALAYFLLVGEPPFTGRNAMQLIVAHVRDPVAPPSAKRPGIPDDLERIVLRCLAKSPHDRYPDVRSLRAELNACEDSGGWTEEDAAAWWAEFASRQPRDHASGRAADEVNKEGVRTNT